MRFSPCILLAALALAPVPPASAQEAELRGRGCTLDLQVVGDDCSVAHVYRCPDLAEGETAVLEWHEGELILESVVEDGVLTRNLRQGAYAVAFDFDRGFIGEVLATGKGATVNFRFLREDIVGGDYRRASGGESILHRGIETWSIGGRDYEVVALLIAAEVETGERTVSTRWLAPALGALVGRDNFSEVPGMPAITNGWRATAILGPEAPPVKGRGDLPPGVACGRAS